MRAFASALERWLTERLSRSQHILFRLGELIAAAETVAILAEHSTQAIPLK